MSTKEQRQRSAQLQSQIESLTGRTGLTGGCLDHGPRPRGPRRKINPENCTIIGHISDDPVTGEEIFTPNPELDKAK